MLAVTKPTTIILLGKIRFGKRPNMNQTPKENTNPFLIAESPGILSKRIAKTNQL